MRRPVPFRLHVQSTLPLQRVVFYDKLLGDIALERGTSYELKFTNL